MRVIRINTTAYGEEDFYLMTDLTEEQIVHVIEPIVLAERAGHQEYDSEILVDALKQRYKGKVAVLYQDFETIII